MGRPKLYLTEEARKAARARATRDCRARAADKAAKEGKPMAQKAKKEKVALDLSELPAFVLEGKQRSQRLRIPDREATAVEGEVVAETPGAAAYEWQVSQLQWKLTETEERLALAQRANATMEDAVARTQAALVELKYQNKLTKGWKTASQKARLDALLERLAGAWPNPDEVKRVISNTRRALSAVRELHRLVASDSVPFETRQRMAVDAEALHQCALLLAQYEDGLETAHRITTTKQEKQRKAREVEEAGKLQAKLDELFPGANYANAPSLAADLVLFEEQADILAAKFGCVRGRLDGHGDHIYHLQRMLKAPATSTAMMAQKIAQAAMGATASRRTYEYQGELCCTFGWDDFLAWRKMTAKPAH